MPWPPKQRTAIYLDTKRRKGAKAASEFMHKHGYGKDHKKKMADEAKKRSGSRHRHRHG